MRLALFQPDIPQNLGAAIRLTACLGVPLDVIRPAAFPLGSAELRRAGMDYGQLADITLHDSWAAFAARLQGRRLVLLTTAADQTHHEFRFQPDDTLLLGRESAGVPDSVHTAADHRVRIAMRPEARSLNVVIAGAMALGEALRQVGSSPKRSRVQ